MSRFQWWRRLCVRLGYKSFFNASEWPKVSYLLIRENQTKVINSMKLDGWVEEFDDE